MEPNLNYEHQRDIDYDNLHPRIKELMKIPQHEQRSEAWFAARKDRLTASNVDAVLGRNKYNSREEILFKKCGISAPFKGNKFTQHGADNEDNAIAEYCRIYNKKTIDFGLLPHDTIGFLAGSPDGIAFDNGDPNCKPVVLEVKCPFTRDPEPGCIPEHYLSQLLINMEITKFDGAFIEYVPEGHCPNMRTRVKKSKFINIIHLEYDPGWINLVLPRLREFWDEVLDYRRNGIETHPEYRRYYLKSIPKKSMTISTKKIKSMFIEDP